MGHLKSLELSDTEPTSAPKRTSTNEVLRSRSSGSRAWFWVVLVVLALAGFWYYRTAHSKTSQDSAAAGAPGQAKAGGPFAPGNFSVPVVVAPVCGSVTIMVPLLGATVSVLFGARPPRFET